MGERPNLWISGLGGQEDGAPDEEDLLQHLRTQSSYPSSQPSSEPSSQPSSRPCSPASEQRAPLNGMQMSPCSDCSSPSSEPPSFDLGGRRICWSSTNPSGLVDEDDLSQPPQRQPQMLGAAAAAAASLAASVAGGDDLEVQIRTAMAEAEGSSLTDALRAPESPTTYSFGDPGSEANISEAFVMTYGDYKLWPMGGGMAMQGDGECSKRDSVPYDEARPRMDLEIDREAEMATQDGRSMSQLYTMDFQPAGGEVPDFQGHNSRACDEVLRYGGQPAVVRGAEALNEARRLAELQSMGSGSSECEGLSAAAEVYLLAASSQDTQPESSASTQVNTDSSSVGGSSREDWEETPASAADLRHGLRVLQELSSGLREEQMRKEEERRRAETGTPAGPSSRSGSNNEVLELRQELQQGNAEREDLQAQISYSENVERRYAATVAELRTELQAERKRRQAETEMAVTAERAAVAAAEREAMLRMSIREEVEKQVRAAALAEARADASAETQRLKAALDVAAGQEAAATSVATQLRGELLKAERAANDARASAGEAGRTAELEKDRAVLEAEKAELAATLESARRSAARESASAAEWRSACDNLQRELADSVAAEAARQIPAAAIEEERQETLAATLDATRREHELRSALAASEHQRELEHANQEAEKQHLRARVEALTRELEVDRQGSLQYQQRLQKAELEATSLKEENRRLHAELLSSFSSTAAAAVEAATAAASSVAALERSRATPSQSYSMLDSPAPSIVSQPVARRLLQDPESLAATPSAASLRSAGEPGTSSSSSMARLLQSSRMRTSSNEPGPGAAAEIQQQSAAKESECETPPRRKAVTPSGIPKDPNAGDVAAGGASKRPTAKARRFAEEGSKSLRDSDRDEAEVGRDGEEEDREIGYSPLSKPFLGGPLGLARALAMRSGHNRSKSPNGLNRSKSPLRLR